MSTLKHINYLEQLRRELCEKRIQTILPEEMEAVLYNQVEALDAAIDLLRENNKELRPCPFCGGPAMVRRLACNGYFIKCNDCKVMGETYDSELEARVKWNTRINT